MNAVNLRIFILMLVLFLFVSACSENTADLDRVQMVELNQENERLISELSTVTKALRAQQDAQMGFITQQVVGQPVKYLGDSDTLKNVLDRKAVSYTHLTLPTILLV